ncbi:WD and tetratricopeptide repeats [Chamberlinius hualienensis]
MSRKRNIIDWCKRRESLETVNLEFQRRLHVTDSFISRLGLDFELEGHNGCVNCLEWNHIGSLLASGSDDLHITVWDPLKRKKVQSIQTGHHGNIFSVKFVPGTNDATVVSGAADCQIRTYDVNSKEELNVCSCHIGRIKRLATLPQVPHMFWSAAEDGMIMQFDLRTRHSCIPTCSNVLINLKNHLGKYPEAKCIAVNPMRPELLAVGANDPYVRIYDRRKLSLSSVTRAPETQDRMWSRPLYLATSDRDGSNCLPFDSVQYYLAAHLPMKQSDYKRKYRALAATYLTFSPDGKELLLNLGGEQIYIFNVTQPTLVKLFDKDDFLPVSTTKCKENMNGYSNGVVSAVKHHESFSSKGLSPKAKVLKQRANGLFEKHEYNAAIHLYNRAIEIDLKAAVLYENRAASFMKRAWDGDIYAALRDCHTALKLDPDHLKTNFRMAKCLLELKRVKEADECLKIFKERFPDHANSSACKGLAKDIETALSTNTESDNRSPVTERRTKLSELEDRWRSAAYDYETRFCGHCNTTTDIKEANYFGSDSQYVVAGSDDGSIFIWDRWTTNIVRVLKGDEAIVNCLQPHPSLCLMATSGIDPVVRLWTPRPQDGRLDEREILDSNDAATANQKRMNADPREVMLMNMGYRIRGVLDTDDDSESSETSDVQCRLE